VEVSFTLWTMREILKAIPFDVPPTMDAIHLDFSDMAVPHYVKNGFKVSIFYKDDTYPVDAACCIFSPQKMITVVIIIKKRFEDALSTWLYNRDISVLDLCYRRRELYAHESSHLIAIIRAYPSDRSSIARQDFLEKIKAKFDTALHAEQNSMTYRLVSEERPGQSPSVFNKDHFRYASDNLNYFKLYAELMLDYDTLRNALLRILNTPRATMLYIEEISKITLVSPVFFSHFPEKRNEILKILETGLN